MKETPSYHKGAAAGNRRHEPSVLARAFEKLLVRSPDAFETECHPISSDPLRVIWRATQRTAGALYVVKDNELQTISLMLSGIDNASDGAAIEAMGRSLSGADAYCESLAAVRFAPRPTIATFCCRTGGYNRLIDNIQLAFAAPFFHQCAAMAT